MDPQLRPRRAEGIEINRMVDGFVAYQPARDRVHHFNETAILLLELCDGNVPVQELPGLIAEAFQLGEPPVDDVHRCLERLLEEGLLVA
jgi:hypothetical protein